MAKGLKILVTGLETKLEPAMNTMRSLPWGAEDGTVGVFCFVLFCFVLFFSFHFTSQLCFAFFHSFLFALLYHCRRGITLRERDRHHSRWRAAHIQGHPGRWPLQLLLRPLRRLLHPPHRPDHLPPPPHLRTRRTEVPSGYPIPSFLNPIYCFLIFYNFLIS